MFGPIDVVGQNRGEHGVSVGGRLTVQITENVDIFGDGGYRWQDNGDEYNFGAGARMAW